MKHHRRCSETRVPIQGRRKAVLLMRLALLSAMVLTLSACAKGGQLTPMGATLLGDRGMEDPTARAEALPYASLMVRSQGNRALMIMAHRVGEHGRDAYFQAGDYTTLHLRDGLPMSTAGFEAVLLGRQRTEDADSNRYRIHAHWRDANGQEQQDVATARLACEPPRSVEMPLTQLTLERCTERLTWENGNTKTRGVVWRDPNTLRPWGGDMALWPDGPRLRWQVARPWWSEAEDYERDGRHSAQPERTLPQ